MKLKRYDIMVSSKVNESKKQKRIAKVDDIDLPFLSKDEANYDKYVKRIKSYKTSNPALYFKMLNWD